MGSSHTIRSFALPLLISLIAEGRLVVHLGDMAIECLEM